MFRLDGRGSAISIVVQCLLDNSKLDFNTESSNSAACVVYRRDPLDRYLFVTAIAGVREIEPMFGPIVFDDLRRPGRHRSEAPNPLGFAARENIKWHHKYSDDNWEIHLSGRGDEGPKAQFEEGLHGTLKDLLADDTAKSVPLFPDLWYAERQGREDLTDAMRGISAPSSLPLIAAVIRDSIKRTMDRASNSRNQNFIALYMDTGDGWQITAPTWQFPVQVEHRSDASMANAFDWVSTSTRPVLVRHPTSSVWRVRLQNCAGTLDPTKIRSFQGIIVVPLLEHSLDNHPVGLLVCVSCGEKPIGPGHVFLLSRLAVAASQYLSGELPFPGCSWWPEVPYGRNAAAARWTQPPDGARPLIERVATLLMPEKSIVELTPLRSGASGARVFRCSVWDSTGRPEVPRIIKVADDPNVIQREAKKYYHFVNNRPAGYASRIDAAKISNAPDDRWGAIAYLLVGGGEQAEAWSEWAARSDRSLVDQGLELLFNQLMPWYIRADRALRSATSLFITEPFFGTHQTFEPYKKDATNPSWDDVSTLLGKVSQENRHGSSRTCTVHGDLHADNVFSIVTGEKDRLVQVAMIDWGSVHGARHPLSDIAKLMVDLVFRIRWHHNYPGEWSWAQQVVQDWQEKVGIVRSANDWKFSLLHHASKMLFYEGDESSCWFAAEAREAAWKSVAAMFSQKDSEAN